MKKWAIILGLALCAGSVKAQNWKRLNKRYQKAVDLTATRSDAERQYNGLAAVANQGKVLVTCWKGYLKPYGQKGDTIRLDSEKYLTWVFQKSELQQKGKSLKLNEKEGHDLSIRMDQLLGLAPNPSDTSRHFVEMWVNPNDLFRPCPDPEITDTECELYLPSNPSNVKVGSLSYRQWFVNNIYEAYYQESQQPWTRLGYTWDWNRKNKKHIGLSEYILKPGAVVIINDILPTEEWMKKNIQ